MSSGPWSRSVRIHQSSAWWLAQLLLIAGVLAFAPNVRGETSVWRRADLQRPVFLELTLGSRFAPVEHNGYLELFMSHAPTEPDDKGNQLLLCGDFGVGVSVPIFHWLEVGGGLRALYGAWDAEPWTPIAFEAVGVEVTGHVRFNLWLMDNWATRVPGNGGMDGGVFVDLALGVQVPMVLFRDRADADGIFLFRPMAGMIFRFGPNLHWMLGGGYAFAIAHDGWSGNPGPSLQGSFILTAVGMNLR
jgi:hypothetical protein